MPQPAQRQENYYYYYGNQRQSCVAIPNYKKESRVKNPYKRKVSYIHRNKPKISRSQVAARFLGIVLMLLVGIFVLPIAFRNITVQMLFKSNYPNITVDSRKIVFPTLRYLNNNLFLGEYMLTGAVSAKSAAMSELLEGEVMSDLEQQLINIMPLYPDVQPSIFVWDYETGNYADINADEMYSAASIIKIPVLISLFKSIETNQVKLQDKMVLKSHYRAEGSGGLQYKAENSVYSLDNLARIMITDSDNSSTNMIMSKIGSMNAVNNYIHSWGLSRTQVNTWLPDLDGNNHTTAKELVRMLYNIDNPNFLSEESRLKIKDYMSHVKNSRLIASGLGQGATFIHKTGDIGKMLGDAGIVTMPNGKKYIVVIMANRPYNSPQGKDFIVKASDLIYNYMSSK